MRRTEKEILDKVKSIHGNKYSLINFNFISYKEKVNLICEYHGNFEISLNNLISNKRGCPECGRSRAKNSCRSNRLEFISKANKVHNFKYRYDYVEYYNWIKKVIITCPIHGDFIQSPNKHLQGYGCSKCNKFAKTKLKIEKLKHNKEEIILKNMKIS